MSKTYKVVFTNQLQPGVSRGEAAKNVSQALNLSVEKSETLFSRGKAIVIKKNVSYEIAKKYEEKLTEAGLHIQLKQESNDATTSNSSSQKLANTDNNIDTFGSPKQNLGEKGGAKISSDSHIKSTVRCNDKSHVNVEICFFKAWIINSVLAFGMAVIAGLIIGFITGIVLSMARVDKGTIQLISTLIGLPCGFISSFYFYKWSINKYIIPQL